VTAQEVRRLLGGYATATLTPEEMRALFEAALDDQELFNELNREQVLRDVLDDGSTRQEVLAAMARADALSAPVRRWHWYRWALAGVAASALIALGITLWILQRPPAEPLNVSVAKLQEPQPAALPPPVPPPQMRAPAAHRRLQREEQPAPPPAQAQSAPVGSVAPLAAPAFQAVVPEQVSWAILKQDQSGDFAETPASIVLHEGDQIRIRVRPIANGDISLLETTAGETTVSPLPATAVAGTDYELPATGTVTVHRNLVLALRFIPAPRQSLAQPQEAAKSKAAARPVITIPIPLNVE
jgi:hypothetical protein